MSILIEVIWNSTILQQPLWCFVMWHHRCTALQFPEFPSVSNQDEPQILVRDREGQNEAVATLQLTHCHIPTGSPLGVNQHLCLQVFLLHLDLPSTTVIKGLHFCRMPTQPRSEERTNTGFTMSSWATAHAGGFQFVLTNFTPFWAACHMGIKFQHHQTEHNLQRLLSHVPQMC